jgi:hypothetical protein
MELTLGLMLWFVLWIAALGVLLREAFRPAQSKPRWHFLVLACVPAGALVVGVRWVLGG